MPARSFKLFLRRQTKNGPVDANFIITPVDDESRAQATALVADLEYQANSAYASIFGPEFAPIRAHIFELEYDDEEEKGDG